MPDIKENILRLRQEKGLSRAAFAEMLGTTPDKINNIEAGRQRVDHEILAKLSNAFSVDLNRLVNGSSENLYILPNDIASPDFVTIPRLSIEASAGPGALVDEEHQSGSYAFNRKWLERRRLKPDNLSVIAVRGDSMEPRLTDGDLILVDRAQCQIADGLTYVIRVEDDLMVKMVQHTVPGMIILISANDYYPPREINLRDNGNQTEIIGRVVASMQEW